MLKFIIETGSKQFAANVAVQYINFPLRNFISMKVNHALHTPICLKLINNVNHLK